jgi:DMSO/TMAO reductase YedYZ molybdopterin-dependent catalytic subunit
MFGRFRSPREAVGAKDRLPAGQHEVKDWPVLHAGSVPAFDPRRWDFKASGLVEHPIRLTYQEFQALPRVTLTSDIHCVTTWSRLDNVWEGVSTREILRRAMPKPEARHVIVHAEHGYTANMPLEVFAGEDCLFADTHDGKPLTPEHGFPLRLVVPKLYFWKSAKWVRGIELADRDKRGFWEVRGYSNTADPWTEDRYA